MYSIYILHSQKIDKFYIGYSGNVANRIAYHNNKVKNKIWMRRGIPWELFFTLDCSSEKQALQIAYQEHEIPSVYFKFKTGNN